MRCSCLGGIPYMYTDNHHIKDIQSPSKYHRIYLCWMCFRHNHPNRKEIQDICWFGDFHSIRSIWIESSFWPWNVRQYIKDVSIEMSQYNLVFALRAQGKSAPAIFQHVVEAFGELVISYATISRTIRSLSENPVNEWWVMVLLLHSTSDTLDASGCG
jgi:hypothetical protein